MKVEHLSRYRDEPPKINITFGEFSDLLETILHYLEHIKPRRKKPEEIDKAINIVNEMMFIGRYSSNFRQENYFPLEEFCDDLYAELHETEET